MSPNVTRMMNHRLSPSPALDTEQSALLADWLASVFIAPQQSEALTALLQPGEIDALGEMGSLLGIETTTDQMRQALDAMPVSRLVEGLTLRYSNLFEGLPGGRTIPLRESAWHTERRRLIEEPLTEMQAILRRLDVSANTLLPEPADHISMQLGALAIALRTGDQDTTNVLLCRLCAWIPRFAKTLKTVDPDGFYGGAATVLIVFVTAASESR